MSTWLHRFAHFLDRSQAPCVCRVVAFREAIAMRRDAELRGIGLAKSPDEMDRAFRALIAASERGVELLDDGIGERTA